MRLRLASPLALLVFAGCLTHLSPWPTDRHLALPWAPDFAAAKARALREHKPLLVCLVAGELDGPC